MWQSQTAALRPSDLQKQVKYKNLVSAEFLSQFYKFYTNKLIESSFLENAEKDSTVPLRNIPYRNVDGTETEILLAKYYKIQYNKQIVNLY